VCRQDQLRFIRAVHRWKNTPYKPSQCTPGVGVDCLQFVGAVVDEYLGLSTKHLSRIPALPPDTAFHTSKNVAKMSQILHDRWPLKTIRCISWQDLVPTDIVLIQESSISPSHLMIADVRKGMAWHSTNDIGVCCTPLRTLELDRIWRILWPK